MCDATICHAAKGVITQLCLVSDIIHIVGRFNQRWQLQQENHYELTAVDATADKQVPA